MCPPPLQYDGTAAAADDDDGIQFQENADVDASTFSSRQVESLYICNGCISGVCQLRLGMDTEKAGTVLVHCLYNVYMITRCIDIDRYYNSHVFGPLCRSSSQHKENTCEAYQSLLFRLKRKTRVRVCNFRGNCPNFNILVTKRSFMVILPLFSFRKWIQQNPL